MIRERVIRDGLAPGALIGRPRRRGGRVARGGEGVDTHGIRGRGRGLVRRFLSGEKRSGELVDNRAS